MKPELIETPEQYQQDIKERAMSCARFGSVVFGHGYQIVYDETLAGPAGMDYVLFKEPQHTKDHLRNAIKKLRNRFDVVNVYVKELTEPLDFNPTPEATV